MHNTLCITCTFPAYLYNTRFFFRNSLIRDIFYPCKTIVLSVLLQQLLLRFLFIELQDKIVAKMVTCVLNRSAMIYLFDSHDHLALYCSLARSWNIRNNAIPTSHQKTWLVI